MVAKVPLPGLKRYFDRRVNKMYYYHRKSGTRLSSTFGTTAFITEFNRIDAAWQKKTSKRATFGHLIDKYRESPEFLRLAPRTKSDYERVMDYLVPLREMPTSAIDSAFVMGVRNKAFTKHKRRFAIYVVQVLSRIFKVGKGLGLMPDNPAADIEKIKKAKGERHLNRPWTVEERDAVMAAAPPSLLGPIAFMRYLGARIGDVLKLKNEAYADGRVTFITSKGEVEVTVPCPAPLARILDARVRHETHLFVSNLDEPWTESGYRSSWRKLRLKLEGAGKIKPGLTSHGLRHSVATDLRELGKSEREIADILGQKTTYAVPTYSRSADMRRSNARVIAELHAEPGTDPV